MKEYVINQVGKILSCTEKIILQKYDNNISGIRFELDSNMTDYVYVGFGAPKSNDYFLKELDSNSFIVFDSSITKTTGLWKLILISTNSEIIDGNFDEYGSVYITQSIELIRVEDNFLNDSLIVEQPLETSTNHITPIANIVQTDNGAIITITDRMGTTTATILNGTGEGGGTIGADGKSAYQIEVENGFVGTEEEWLVSLKGQQGIQGIAGTNGTGIVNQNSGEELMLWAGTQAQYDALTPVVSTVYLISG